MAMLGKLWALSQALGKNPVGLFLSFVLVLVRKKLVGRSSQNVTLYIKGKSYPFSVRDAADIAALHEVFVDNEYACPVTDAKHIVDIGGHVGSASVYFATHYPGASITVYEADPANFDVLSLNTKAFPNIRCMHAAVSDVRGDIEFYANPSSISSSMIKREDSIAVTVRSVTLDDVLAESADIVKFDIEGAEYRMCKASMRRTSVPVFVGELHYDLMGADLAAFTDLFPDYQSRVRPVSANRALILLQKAIPSSVAKSSV